jgi:hypothetical protein
MAKTTQITQNTPLTGQKCLVEEQPDGGLHVHFLIEPDVAVRIRRRAHTMPLDRYIWENILKRNIVDHVF